MHRRRPFYGQLVNSQDDLLDVVVYQLPQLCFVIGSSCLDGAWGSRDWHQVSYMLSHSQFGYFHWTKQDRYARETYVIHPRGAQVPSCDPGLLCSVLGVGVVAWAEFLRDIDIITKILCLMKIPIVVLDTNMHTVQLDLYKLFIYRLLFGSQTLKRVRFYVSTQNAPNTDVIKKIIHDLTKINSVE